MFVLFVLPCALATSKEAAESLVKLPGDFSRLNDTKVPRICVAQSISCCPRGLYATTTQEIS
jgi:hypothetical protein